jgi:hypothetical protein
VLLEDRSIWKVDPSEMARVRCWPQWARIRVHEAGANAYWLIGEVLGRQECVLALFAGFLHTTSAAAAAAPEPTAPPTTNGFTEPDL